MQANTGLKRKNVEYTISICCLAYNHEQFIRKCMDGFLMQATNFRFEVLIHDDASTDNTASIIKDYQKRFPNIVFPIYQKENQYTQGVSITATYNWPRVRGKYIAMCEGDDYWTDPLKLQKQVDFLEENEDFVCCSHLSDTVYNFQRNIKVDAFSTLPHQSGVLTLRRYKMINGFHTSSMVYRSNLLTEFPVNRKELLRDTPIKLWLLSRGAIKILPDKMSVYRRNLGGVSERLSVREIYETELAAARALKEELQGFYLQGLYLISNWHYYYLCNGYNLGFFERCKVFIRFISIALFISPFNTKRIINGIWKVMKI